MMVRLWRQVAPTPVPSPQGEGDAASSPSINITGDWTEE